jgi:hypothetical protein
MTAAMTIAMALMAHAATTADGVLSFRPAHWADDEEPPPLFRISPLRSLAFPSPTEGWIVGDRHVLHVRGDQLEVAFVDRAEALRSISFSNAEIGWAGGIRRDAPPLLRYRAGAWRDDPLRAISWAHWGIGRVMAGPAGDAWAVACVGAEGCDEMQPATLRFDGTQWSVDEQLLAGRPEWRLADACQSPDGTWWFVGADESASGRRMLLLRWESGASQTVALAASEAKRSDLYHVRCLPDGTVWAAGDERAVPGETGRLVLKRFRGEWESLAVPVEFPRDPHMSALAPVSADEVWLAASCDNWKPDCCEQFLHYHRGSWETLNVPFMPDGRCTRVGISDMQFVSPDEGWAIGTDMQPFLGGGRIFHYRNGTWRLRNWTWHFWDAPWFGLFSR